MNIHRFKFADHAAQFDEHIMSSIPGLRRLRSECVMLSQRFIQGGTTVIDVGCSTGQFLAGVRDHNAAFHQDVEYVGIDIEAKFSAHWQLLEKPDLHFQVADVRTLPLEGLSFASGLFTLQFLPEKDKRPVLKKIHAGLVTGGALVIAEKVLASSARLQDALVPPYYDFKRECFSSDEILDKERALRGVMTCWSEDEIKDALASIGFREIQLFWSNFPFKAFVAVK